MLLQQRVDPLEAARLQASLSHLMLLMLLYCLIIMYTSFFFGVHNAALVSQSMHWHCSIMDRVAKENTIMSGCTGLVHIDASMLCSLIEVGTHPVRLHKLCIVK